MRLLLFMRHAGYGRNFASTIAHLAERGHQVHVLLGDGGGAWWLEEGRGPVTRLARERPEVTVGPAPDGLPPAWRRLGSGLRLMLDYLRYFEPAYAEAPALRARAGSNVPAPLRRVVEAAGARPRARRALRRVLRALERALPRSEELDRLIRDHAPDLVVVTPLVELGAPQTSVVRAAREAGVPVALAVASWDNLTNKGVLHEVPDHLLVWNERQRDEAVALHDVAPDAVTATGAQPYDHWFDWRPSTSREAFCAVAGLAPDRPFLLYLCSSRFIAPHEVPFVRELVERLRGHDDPGLATAGVLVRPHPQNAGQWADVDVRAWGPEVVVWPREGEDPVDEDGRRGYFDSIHHSAGVVGINTSALIESGIVGRSVHTLLHPAFAGTQGGTLHFSHLTDAGGGLLRVARSWDEHLDQLTRTLRAGPGSREDHRGFLEAFVRPQGLERASTPLVADALERVAAAGPLVPYAPPATAPALRALLRPVAALAQLMDRAWARAAARQSRSRSSASAKGSTGNASMV